MSDCGTMTLTVIAMLGSPFSPGYAKARAQGAQVDPLDFVALNVALDAPGHRGFALTERPRRDIRQGRDSLGIGPSGMAWEGDQLVVHFDERTSPWGQRLAGSLVVDGSARHAVPEVLDAAGQHRWYPVAPIARFEARLTSPDVTFRGFAYHDANEGQEPLERAFRSWAWSRVSTDVGTTVAYDVEPVGGFRQRRTFAFDRQATPRRAPDLVDATLPRTGYGLSRTVRVDPGGKARLVRTLEDTPFYARSLVDLDVGGRAARGVHEQLDLERFTRPWVQFLIPFKMRVAR